MDDFNLSGKTAVVCGLWEGIGEQTSLILARHGAEVLVVEADEKLAGPTVEAIERDGGRARLLCHDPACADGIAAAFGHIAEDHPRLDILVNTSNRGHYGALLEITEADLDAMIQANVKSVFHATRAALPLMLEGGGAIVNVASVFAMVAMKHRFAYLLTKGALVSMMRSVAADYAEKNVRCNCVCPGRIDTAFGREWVNENFPGREEETLREMAEFHPLGRMGRPEEVAALILYLCSDEAAFVTGQAYPIDGGATAVTKDAGQPLRR
jgi:NAD(P)-dependent dehydrogenase (short-subunit alcohol dehydrogenase family)